MKASTLSGYKQNPSWCPDTCASQLILEDKIFLPIFEFSAAAEISTQHAFNMLARVLEIELEKFRGRKNDPEANFIVEFREWLHTWVVEEARHVSFFSLAFSKLSHDNLGKGNSTPQVHTAKIRTLGIESPIPDTQHWHTTLFFLLFSEIISMIWYRRFLRAPVSPALRQALRHIHRDEATHYKIFLDACCRLTATHPHLNREARRVFASFLISYKRNKQVTYRPTSAGHIDSTAKIQNWWEHPAFLSFVSIDELNNLSEQAISIQRYSLNKMTAESIKVPA
jgi:hypothetical protein